MKKLLTLFLAICLLALPVLSACKKEETPEELEAPTTFNVTKDGAAACTIVYARGTGYRSRMSLADDLAAFIKQQTGVTVKVLSDEEATDSTGAEILIGNTNREASTAAKAAVSDECTYVIRVVGNKLAVVAGSEGALSAAVDLLTSGSRTLGYKLSNNTMTFSATLDYVKREILVLSTEHMGFVCNLLGMENFRVVQGGCTDGTYMYVCMEDQAGNYEESSLHRTIICKLEIATGTLVAKSEALELDHSNDMAYNSGTGELIVVHCGKGESSKKLSFLDPETLTVTRTRMLESGTYALAYNQTRDQYVSAGGGSLSVRNANFVVQRSGSTFSTGHVTQGIDCDDDYIYSVLTGDGKDGVNDSNFGYLVISTWEGKLVATCRIPLPSGETSEIETECIFHVGHDFYVVYNARTDSQAGHIHKFTIRGLWD